MNKSKEILDKFATKIIRKDAVFPTSEEGKWGVDQNKSEDYLGDNYSEDIVLMYTPFNCLRIEFEDEPETNKKYISVVEATAKATGYQYCVTEHNGGKSPYFNIFDLPIPEEAQDWKNFKLMIVDQLLPNKLKGQLDKTNLGFTLSPVIGHPHWKPKYKGAIHEIVRGINPVEQKNRLNPELKEILKRLKSSKKRFKREYLNLNQNNKWVERFLLDYCLNNKLPKGNRHNIICKNVAIIIAFRGDKHELMELYSKTQGNKTNEIIGWITGVLNGTYNKIGVGELRNYIIENDIPFDTNKYNKIETLEDNAAQLLNDCQNPYINVLNMYKSQKFFYDTNGLYWFWDKKEKQWVMKDDTDVMIIIDKAFNFVGSTISSKIKSEYLESIKRVGRSKIPEKPPYNWIQFKDKIFDFKTKECFDASPEYFICNPIPFSPSDDEETPVIDKLFEEWVGTKHKKRLYEIIAYCTLADYPIHLIFCFTGIGSNGKSKYINLVRKFIGTKNSCSTELDVLMKSNFESSKLYKKLICCMGETNFGTMNKTSMIKKLSGQDLISFEFKNKNPFDDTNYAKLLISSNSMPLSDDTTDGFYRRWLITDFPNQFPDGKDILETIPEKEYNNLARKCINVLPELIEKGEFEDQGNIKKRKNDYIMASNPFPKFLESCCVERFDTDLRYQELYNAYVFYLGVIKKKRVTKRNFSDILSLEGIEFTRTSKKIGENWVVDRYIDNYGLIEKWKENLITDDKDDSHDFHDSHDSDVSSALHRESKCTPSHKGHESHETDIFDENYAKILKETNMKEVSCQQMSVLFDVGIFDVMLQFKLKKGDYFESKKGFIQKTD